MSLEYEPASEPLQEGDRARNLMSKDSEPVVSVSLRRETAQGRPYYVDHASKQTHWFHPQPLYVFTYIYVYILYIHIHIHIYVSICIHLYMNMNIYIYIFIYNV